MFSNITFSDLYSEQPKSIKYQIWQSSSALKTFFDPSVGCNWGPPNTYFQNLKIYGVLCPLLSDQTKVFQVYGCSELAVVDWGGVWGSKAFQKAPHIWAVSSLTKKIVLNLNSVDQRALLFMLVLKFDPSKLFQTRLLILEGSFYWVYFTGYPSNHFSGCRLSGQLLSTNSFWT